MWEFFETVNPWIAAVTGFLAITTILEKVSKIKLWTWLLGWLGDRTNAKLTQYVQGLDGEVKVFQTELHGMKTDIQDIKSDVSENRYKTVKKEILDFSGALMNGKEHSAEQYSHILAVITEYDTMFKDKHNGEVAQTIRHIKSEHNAFMESKTKSNRAKARKEQQCN